MSEWKTYTMEEVIEHFIDYRGKTPKKTTYGIPLITAKIVKNGFIEEPDEFIAEDYYDSWMRRGLPEIGDVVMTTEAPLGEVAQIKTSAKIALGQRIITLRGKPDLLDNTFLRFILQGATVQGRLKARGTGSTVQGIKSSELKKVQIDLPPLPEQKKIARVLGNIDDKIELNRQMNKTLEAMAMTLYRHYFIDFGLPPNAKYEADECPFGKLVDTDEMGPMPEDWIIGSLEDISFLNPESWLKDTMPDEIQYVDLSNTKKGEIIDIQLYKKIDAPSRAKRILKSGDIIFGTVRPANRSYALINYDGLTGSTGFAVLRPKKQMYREYIYNTITSNSAVQHFHSIANGAAYPAVNPEVIHNYKAIIPPDDISTVFHHKTHKIYNQISNNQNEIILLSNTRNYLLPKLLTGEVRVQ